MTLRGIMAVRTRLCAALLVVLVFLGCAVRPVSAAVPAGPATGGCNDGLRGAGFYDSARGDALMQFALNKGGLSKASTNFAGTWFMSPAQDILEEDLEDALNSIWSTEPDISIRFYSVNALKSGTGGMNAALYAELEPCIDLNQEGRLIQAVSRSAGATGGDHSEDVLLRFKASVGFVDDGLRKGWSRQRAVAEWKKYEATLPKRLKDRRAKLRDGDPEYKPMKVRGVTLDDSTVTERQTCGNKSDSGCTASAPHAGHSVDYNTIANRSASTLRVLSGRTRWLLNRLADRKSGNLLDDVRLLVKAAEKKAKRKLTDKQAKKGNTIGTRTLRLTIVQGMKNLIVVGDAPDARQLQELSGGIFPKGEEPSYDKLAQQVNEGRTKANNAVNGLYNTSVCCDGDQEQGSLPLGGPRMVRAGVAALPGTGCCAKTQKTSPAPSGLRRQLAAAAAGNNGGIDFSSLQLRYLADKPAGNGVSSIRYAFSGARTSGDPHATQGITDAKQASDAFFVWLALPRSSFWVNLNPDEPDRIINAKMGRTDVGRVMLQADLGLKDADAPWMDPHSPTGGRFWSELKGNCFTFRLWIVPGTASVYDGGDELYIEKAPLKVMMESDYFHYKGMTDAGGCAKKNPVADKANERLYQDLILPKVEKKVNSAPQYAELRRVYRARIAAEWYRRRSAQHATAYKSLIDDGNIGRWAYHGSWTPQKTFGTYKSRLGKHKVVIKTHQGGYVYKETYTYGGVDWTSLPYQSMDRAAFAYNAPGMAARVGRSLTTPNDIGGGQVLLGGTVAVPTGASAGPPWAVIALVGGVVVVAAGGAGLLVMRRRRVRA